MISGAGYLGTLWKYVVGCWINGEEKSTHREERANKNAKKNILHSIQRPLASSYFLSASSARNRASLSWFSSASILSSSDRERFSSTFLILRFDAKVEIKKGSTEKKKYLNFLFPVFFVCLRVLCVRESRLASRTINNARAGKKTLKRMWANKGDFFPFCAGKFRAWLLAFKETPSSVMS